MLDILTIGDIKWDTFLVLPHASVQCALQREACQLCVEYGKKIPVESSLAQVAGSAPNVAVGVARMKFHSAVLSTMGKDAIYASALQFLKKERVETRYIRSTSKRPSSFAAVLNFQGESTQLVVHQPVDIRLPARMPRAAWMHISELGEGYVPLLTSIIRYAKRHGVRLSVNPGQIQLDERHSTLKELLAVTEVLFINLREAREYLRLPSLNGPDAAQRLAALGPRNVVVTDGKNGAYSFDGQHTWYAPMFPGTRVEATGAGDAFCTGYLGAMLSGKTFAEALAWGAVNSASVVSSVGPTAGLLTHTEIRRRLNANPAYAVHPSV